MYADETPILESVFVSLAPDAVSITDIITAEPLFDGSHDYGWFFEPLSYRELLEWTSELATAS
jgi:hypothetical protein